MKVITGEENVSYILCIIFKQNVNVVSVLILKIFTKYVEKY